jgi:hypothetical protein
MTCKHDWHFLPGTDRLRCIRCNVETGPSTPEQLAQDMLRDVVLMGSAWSQNGKRIDPAEVYADPVYAFHKPQPNSIKFYNGAPDNTEVLRISKDGIWANPDVPADDAAQAVLRAIDGHIKQMVERVRSEYTTVAWGVFEGGNLHDMFFLEVEAKEMARLKGEHAVVSPLIVWGQP